MPSMSISEQHDLLCTRHQLAWSMDHMQGNSFPPASPHPQPPLQHSTGAPTHSSLSTRALMPAAAVPVATLVAAMWMELTVLMMSFSSAKLLR